MDIEQHTANKAPNHRAVPQSLACAVNGECPAVGVTLVGNTELGFEEVACFLEGPCMDEAYIAVESVAAAEHTSHPWNNAVITASRIEVLFYVWFTRGACYLILHFFVKHWD